MAWRWLDGSTGFVIHWYFALLIVLFWHPYSVDPLGFGIGLGVAPGPGHTQYLYASRFLRRIVICIST